MLDHESCRLEILQIPRNSPLVRRLLSWEGLKSGILSDLAIGSGTRVGYKFLCITLLKPFDVKHRHPGAGGSFLGTTSEWWLTQKVASGLWNLI